MTPTPIPAAAIGASNPTSRSIFRHLTRAVGATNREADDLRREILGRMTGGDGKRRDRGLASELRQIDVADPTGTLGAESRLAIWFAHAAGGDREYGERMAESWGETTEASSESMAEVARLLREPT
ncbi:hypothetical protein [Actinospongicola halichondriae]|uniref:hypothetical protein n=1 Tax=Actinospongicola halichondriae TaxID=3236844 RepID=UPI003D3E4FDF